MSSARKDAEDFLALLEVYNVYKLNQGGRPVLSLTDFIVPYTDATRDDAL